jgi:hypothetical protein
MDRVQIAMRLANWGLCQRGRGGGSMVTRETRSVSPYGGQGYKCMTDVVCTIIRDRVNGPPPGKKVLASMNFEDAAIIQRAYMQLSIKHQMLLKNLYVLGQSPNAICRQLSIKHTPGHHWNRELYSAQEAIDDILNGGNR